MFYVRNPLQRTGMSSAVYRGCLFRRVTVRVLSCGGHFEIPVVTNEIRKRCKVATHCKCSV
jgi:hypothetical protein